MAVQSAPASYNVDLSAALWGLSADKCKLFREVSVASSHLETPISHVK